MSRTFFSRLLRARKRTLYRQLSKEIRRQLPIFLLSPFFGIIFIFAVLKVGVKLSLRRHSRRYLCKGTRNKAQNFLIKQLLKPSIPAALLLPCIADISNSSVEISPSSSADLAADRRLSLTILELQISRPRKSSIQFSGAGTWPAGILYKSHKNS
jgi:hypothetical protein